MRLGNCRIRFFNALTPAASRCWVKDNEDVFDHGICVNQIVHNGNLIHMLSPCVFIAPDRGQPPGKAQRQSIPKPGGPERVRDAADQ